MITNLFDPSELPILVKMDNITQVVTSFSQVIKFVTQQCGIPLTAGEYEALDDAFTSVNSNESATASFVATRLPGTPGICIRRDREFESDCLDIYKPLIDKIQKELRPFRPDLTVTLPLKPTLITAPIVPCQCGDTKCQNFTMPYGEHAVAGMGKVELRIRWNKYYNSTVDKFQYKEGGHIDFFVDNAACCQDITQDIFQAVEEVIENLRTKFTK